MSPEAMTSATVRATPRVVLVGKASFNWLRQFQERAPAPRMDLRYLTEGCIELLGEQPRHRDAWLRQARAAMVAHVNATETSGTVGAASTDEGAEARTAAAPDANRTVDRHGDCKALHIGEGRFSVLKRIQGTTRDPRLEMRYLVEGAIELLRHEPDLLAEVVQRARQALQEHLSQLASSPITPFRMEISA